MSSVDIETPYVQIKIVFLLYFLKNIFFFNNWLDACQMTCVLVKNQKSLLNHFYEINSLSRLLIWRKWHIWATNDAINVNIALFLLVACWRTPVRKLGQQNGVFISNSLPYSARKVKWNELNNKVSAVLCNYKTLTSWYYQNRINS